MKYPYVFFHLQDKDITHHSLEYLKQAEEIHIYSELSHNIVLPVETDIYFYCFSQEQIDFCHQQGYIPHISFLGNDITQFHLYQQYKKSDYEFFWFPTSCEDDTLKMTGDYLNEIELPVCISFHPAFNAHMINEKNRQWLESLYRLFPNPLYAKEMDLIEDYFNEDNIYIHQHQSHTEIHHVVLGLHGDMPFKQKESYMKNNLTSITKMAECQQCDYQDFCIEKGLGYIMTQANYQGCIGIKLFTPAELQIKT